MGPLHTMPIPDAWGDDVAIDFVGPLPLEEGYNALVTMTALAYPDSQVYLLFPPIPLPISVGVGGMICLDILGVIRGWR